MIIVRIHLDNQRPVILQRIQQILIGNFLHTFQKVFLRFDRHLIRRLLFQILEKFFELQFLIQRNQPVVIRFSVRQLRPGNRKLHIPLDGRQPFGKFGFLQVRPNVFAQLSLDFIRMRHHAFHGAVLLQQGDSLLFSHAGNPWDIIGFIPHQAL